MTDETRPMAVVTGAARGLGRVIALTLAQSGFDIALVDMAEPGAVAAEVEQTGSAAWAWKADVAVEKDVLGLVTAFRGRFERVDVLVNNAGISMIAPAEKTSADAWRRVIDVNLTGPFSALPGVRCPDACGRDGLHNQRGVSCGPSGHFTSRRLQCLQAWPDRSNLDPRRGVGGQRGTSQCRVPGLDKNRNGR